ncbi:MAG: hypothetical protein HDS03_10225 [Bacteroides sp.]|nr:hypothetical protein [Bacteroides sp.]MBD5330230.1 hypothetical protein [Bacteroides sp.]
MKIINLKRLYIFLLIVFALTANVAMAGICYLGITPNEGDPVFFQLSDFPIVKTNDNILSVEAVDGTMTWQMKDVKTFSFFETIPSGDIEKVTKTPKCTIRDGIACFIDFEPEMGIRIYGLNGRLLAQTATDSEGAATLDLYRLNEKTIIISAGTYSLKYELK